MGQYRMGMARRVIFVATAFLLCTLEMSMSAPSAAKTEPSTSSREKRYAGCSVELYEHINYYGRKVTIYGANADLSTTNFNDVASSAKVLGPCSWIFYADTSFNGYPPSILDPGNYPTFSHWGQANLTSLRPIPPPGTNAIVLYEFLYAGREIVLYNSVPDIHTGGYNFGDVTSSIIVSGGTWAVFQHTHYGGTQHTIGPGYHRGHGGRNYVSSVKRLS